MSAQCFSPKAFAGTLASRVIDMYHPNAPIEQYYEASAGLLNSTDKEGSFISMDDQSTTIEPGPAGALAGVLNTVFVTVPGAEAGPVMYGTEGRQGELAWFRIVIDDQAGETRKFEVSVKEMDL